MKNMKNKGFSLIELLVSIAILAIIMVMISGFVSSTLIAQRKQKRSMKMQTEGQRIYYQMSEALMQATYIRVEGCKYEKKSDGTEVVDPVATYVPDDYGNYQLYGTSSYGTRKAIVDFDSGILYNEKGKQYPTAGSEMDEDSGTVYSYRALAKPLATGADESMREYYSVIPNYIYIEYSSSKNKKAVVIFKYDATTHEMYMYRSPEYSESELPKKGIMTYSVAKSGVDLRESAGADGLVSEYMQTLTMTMNPDAGSVTLSMELYEDRYEGYGYDLNETVNIRNSNVLTVKPQLLYKWTGKSTTTP